MAAGTDHRTPSEPVRKEHHSTGTERVHIFNLSHLFTLDLKKASASRNKSHQGAAGDSVSSTQGEVCRRLPSPRQASQSAASVLQISGGKLCFIPHQATVNMNVCDAFVCRSTLVR